MKRNPILLLFSMLILLSVTTCFAQKNETNKLFQKKRKKIVLSNYYISLSTHDALTYFSDQLEWKIDSLRLLERDVQIKNNLTFLKYTSTSTLANTTFHTDPLAGGLDTWALLYQLEAYFSSTKAMELYGPNIGALSKLFVDYQEKFKNDFGNNLTIENQEAIKNFAKNNPIENEQLNRKSVSPYLSEWLGNDALGLKGGLITMTDLVRDMTDRMEYYAEMLPKQTKWQMEFEIGEFLSKDSLNSFVKNMSQLLYTTTSMLEGVDEMISINRDTILANIDYQRRSTLQMLRNERIEMVKTMSLEREIVLAAMREERLGIQEFASGERKEMMGDVQKLSAEMITNTTPIGKELIDYVFFKLIIISVILGVFIIVGVVLFKKL